MQDHVANPPSPGGVAIKMMCLCVNVCVFQYVVRCV